MTSCFIVCAWCSVISTHILTKRMTGRLQSKYTTKNISTHILTKRMTFIHLCSPPYLSISTHILTKRMTASDNKCSLLHSLFQLTSSRRGWPSFRLHPVVWYHFNSHPHEEDDKNIYIFCLQVDISTHILTKRMTNHHPLLQATLDISTHILTKRMTPASAPCPSPLEFQLTSSRRGWRNLRVHPRIHSYFNSHPHEEDDEGIEDELRAAIFQLTSSRRGWPCEIRES